MPTFSRESALEVYGKKGSDLQLVVTLTYRDFQTWEAASTLRRINLKTQLFLPDRPSVHNKTAFSVKKTERFENALQSG